MTSRTTRRRGTAAAGLALAAALAVAVPPAYAASPTALAPPSDAARRTNTGTTYATSSWHPVDEPWLAYPQREVTLPAADYCGTFDLRLTPVHDAVRQRVLSRWDNGATRDQATTGTLVVDASNVSTGARTRLDLTGSGVMRGNPAGHATRYETIGPAGLAWPQDGGGLGRGYYHLDGHHVIAFRPDGTSPDGTRTLRIADGDEQNVCDTLR